MSALAKRLIRQEVVIATAILGKFSSSVYNPLKKSIKSQKMRLFCYFYVAIASSLIRE